MRDEEVITTTAAERRLGTALMWTGAILGAMFIAVLGLGFGYWNATANVDNRRSVVMLDTANNELTRQLAEAKSDADKAKNELAAAKERDGRYIEYMQSEYRRLTRREPPREAPPPAFDPLRRP